MASWRSRRASAASEAGRPEGEFPRWGAGRTLSWSEQCRGFPENLPDGRHHRQVQESGPQTLYLFQDQSSSGSRLRGFLPNWGRSRGPRVPSTCLPVKKCKVQQHCTWFQQEPAQNELLRVRGLRTCEHRERKITANLGGRVATRTRRSDVPSECGCWCSGSRAAAGKGAGTSDSQAGARGSRPGYKTLAKALRLVRRDLAAWPEAGGQGESPVGGGGGSAALSLRRAEMQGSRRTDDVPTGAAPRSYLCKEMGGNNHSKYDKGLKSLRHSP